MTENIIPAVTILVLAIFIGYEVITKVPPTLHTPLMSGTNAISGIIIAGALLVAGRESGGTLGLVLGLVTVTVATINVVGGFAVTERMLSKFRLSQPSGRSDDTATASGSGKSSSAFVLGWLPQSARQAVLGSRAQGALWGIAVAALALIVFLVSDSRNVEQIIRDVSYVVAAVLFILGIKMLGSPRTARYGNWVAVGGMLLAIVVTLGGELIQQWWPIIVGLAAGGVVGLGLARYIRFTAMPQLVAIFNGLGGGASAAVAWAELAGNTNQGPLTWLVAVTIAVSTVIGWLTLSGSLVAFAKLQDILPTRPILFPLRHIVNGVLVVAILALATLTSIAVGGDTVWPAWPFLFGALLGLVLLLGFTLVIPIGGADMPVVVALLNSYSGLAAAATGFAIDNNMLIIAGSLVGASGLILTKIMTRAMNRSLANVILGGVGAITTPDTGDGKVGGVVRSITAEDAALVLAYAKSVIVAPGYGLAVAQAQHTVRALADLLKERGVSVSYAIHPVAGRMPGHMNVLLAEANVPYNELKDLEQVNHEFESSDVVIVVGANDVVNPAARNNANSPIYGMPILNADKAKLVIVLKRSMRSGFAGIENELFYKENTAMLFGDAKASTEALAREIKNL